MSDTEDCDDLPPISVNSSTRDSSAFSMPAADALASQRAREEHTERELSRLRLRHSDSSGSEGEAALGALLAAAAPAAAAAPRAREPDRSGARLLAALGLPPHAAADADAAAALTADASGVWGDADVLSIGGALVAALLSRRRRAPLRLARALQTLLDERASPLQARALAAVLHGALSRRARARLADWLRSGGAGADALARRLASGALAELAGDPDAGAAVDASALSELAAGAWRRLADEPRYELLQLAARALLQAGEGEGAGEGLLEALAPPAARAAAAPERLEVMVAASKLRLLFRCGT